ncbi:hypothetical protein [Actinoplanes rectilineatus]|uniref:hypothetical protein n=1 Tax=Actinoplanes rectilineatus TaxID=113571 RepID=UPI0006982973|nr:hypothetical protein [Actinoplanes rectilineatus]
MRRPNIAAIRRRLEAATPGTWKTGDRFGSGSLGSSIAVISGSLPPLQLDEHRNGRNDAAFIAHAHQDVAALLTALDEAHGQIISLVACAERLYPSERHTVLRADGCGWCGGDHLAELSVLVAGSNPSGGAS